MPFFHRSERTRNDIADTIASSTHYYSEPKPKDSLQGAPHRGDFFETPHDEMRHARKVYTKIFGVGTFLTMVLVFAVLPIYWGSLWKLPAHPFDGWVVDYDGGDVGLYFMQNLPRTSNTVIKWTKHSASDIGSLEDLKHDVTEEKVWVAVVINSGVSNALSNALLNHGAAYNESSAITVYVVEARYDITYRSLLQPTFVQILDQLTHAYAMKFAGHAASTLSPQALADLLMVSPQVITLPISYTIDNLRPFYQIATSAASFPGLLFQLLLSFYVVLIGVGARNVSAISNVLTFWALVRIRLISPITSYFFLSLCYSLINLAFQIDFTHKFGRGGFVIFWLLNWCNMMSVGLVLESLVTILTIRFIPFFLILWIIVNVSVTVYPIQILPHIYRYGFGSPFYNTARGFRTIFYDTKNELGLNFGVLVIWMVISCITLPIFQWIVWKRNIQSVIPK